MHVERIKFERTGGFAGMRLAADFELDDLEEDQAHALRELLDDLDFAELPERSSDAKAVADDFTYSITVEADDWKHSITTGESSAPEKMQSLLELLNRIARKQARKQ